LDGGVRDKNPVVAPKVPTGGLIRQAILHDDAYGQGNDAMRVVSLGQGVVGHVCVEILAATSAMMLRVGKVDVAGATGHQIPDVMQDASEHSVSSATLAASRTRPMFVIVTALNDPCSRQILWIRNAFGAIWKIASWSRHSNALLG
jgi:hypothetical protein